MKKQLNLILVLSILLTIGLACEATTANLSDITFAKDKKGKNELQTANAGETIYAIASLNNAGDGYKLVWKTFIEDVSGQEKGTEIKQLTTELDAPGSMKTTYKLTFPPTMPNGKYKIKLILENKGSGKEVDTKSAVLQIKGGRNMSTNAPSEASDEDVPTEEASDEDTIEEDAADEY